MKIVELPIDNLKEATWNVNQADEATMQRLRSSIRQFGFVQNLVVRSIGNEYEVLSGNQRLKLLREFNIPKVPCIIVNLNDAHARLFAQALNHIHGEDDLGLRAELIREVLKTIPEGEVLKILPDTMVGLKGMATLSQATMAGYLQNWEKARTARLRNRLFKLTKDQLKTVEDAIERILPEARRQQGVSPNSRGTALYLICKSYLKMETQNDHK
jgi:ParB family chromosome partitioning protein